MTEIEQNYYKKLLLEYMSSDFYTNKTKVTKAYNELDDEKLDGVYALKSFKDFLLQKESDNDYLVSSLYFAYGLPYEFGHIVELNSGIEESIAYQNTDEGYHMDLVSKYASSDIFGEQPFNYYMGEAFLLSLLDKDSVTKKSSLYLKYLESDINRLKTIKKLKEYDAIFNINPEDPTSILDSYLYGVKNNKLVVSGYSTNIFDKNAEEKIIQYEKIITLLNQYCDIKPICIEENIAATVIRTLLT